jgi:hypothetical protein
VGIEQRLAAIEASAAAARAAASDTLNDPEYWRGLYRSMISRRGIPLPPADLIDVERTVDLWQSTGRMTAGAIGHDGQRIDSAEAWQIRGATP